MTAVNGLAIPEGHHAARPLAPQVFEKRYDVGSMEGIVLAVEVHLALGGNGADRRAVIAGPPLHQDGRLAHGHIGPDDAGQGLKAIFV